MRLSPRLRRMLRAAAKAAGVSDSDFVRGALESAATRSREDEWALGALRHLRASDPPKWGNFILELDRDAPRSGKLPDDLYGRVAQLVGREAEFGDAGDDGGAEGRLSRR